MEIKEENYRILLPLSTSSLGIMEFEALYGGCAEDQERCTRPINLKYFWFSSLEGLIQITVSTTPPPGLWSHVSELKCKVGYLQQTEHRSFTESRTSP